MKLPAILSRDLIKQRIVLGVKDKITVKEAIRCLEMFDYFFELSPEEENLYQETGYLLPSLRPVGSLAISTD